MEGLGMDAAQLDTQRKKGEAILKTSSTPTRPTGRVPQLDRPSFNSIELRSQSQTRKMSFGAFWDRRTWCMDAAQLDTQRKKEEAILKTSSTTYSTTGRVPQLDRPSFNSIELRSQSQTRKMLLPP
ncbi:unnamed protein product [Microthlaspi erraticum]|uniref:Uncharacterized protein n=1 Tax=Microthlaspi erraticum TaxID=1685480 RepID=A0A6D2K9A7_9BRAS|nr:unnamed protein product [Microthlaspi erraticum]